MPDYVIAGLFTRAELACPTSGEIKFCPGFLPELKALRVEYDAPMTVTSGCRSDEHNEWLQRRGYKASPNSFHLIGNEKYGTDTCAIDVARPNGPACHRLITVASARGWTIGVAKTFIHLDLRVKYTDLPPTIYDYF